MRRLLAIFCLLLFSCQAIPVRGIAKLLSKDQATEDVQDDNSCCDDDAGLTALYGSDIIMPPAFFDLGAANSYIELTSAVTIRITQALPGAYIGKVPVPPPDPA